MSFSPYNLFSISPEHNLPPLLKDVVFEVQGQVKAPMPLVVSSALAAVSVACQGIADVRRMESLEGPISLWFLSIAESGERKTTVDNLFMRPIRDFQASNDRRILYSDTSIEALVHSLKDQPSAGLVSDEGSSVFNGQAITAFGTLNTLWGGGELPVDRRGAKPFTIRDARLTVALMAQPDAFRKFLDCKGKEARDTGFLARCLVSQPFSTQGFRQIDPNSPSAPLKHLPEFQSRLASLLADGQNPRRLLSFDPAAQRYWGEIYNWTEGQMSLGGRFHHTKDHGAKFAENVARLAALFHIFEGYEGDRISRETLERADSVIRWYSNEFVRIFSPPPEIPREQLDANLLETWLAEQVRSRGFVKWRRSALLQSGPNALRHKTRLGPALDSLVSRNILWVTREGKTTWLNLNFNHFTPVNIQFLCNRWAI